MITLVALAKRMPHLDPEEFRSRWVDEHAPGTDYEGLVSYRIGICQPPAEGELRPPYDGIALMTFTSREAFDSAAASPQGKARSADAQEFCESLTIMWVDEYIIPVGD
jgi:uncharacterized protein (TIGR02118 family)